MRGWRAHKRDAWLTSVLGLALLIVIPVLAVTGLLSNAAYNPRLGSNVLAQGRPLGPLDFYVFGWPSSPAWLYALTQGLHVTVGLGAFPIVLVKVWSVLGRSLRTERQSTPAGALERFLVLLLVGAVLFESFTGFFEIEYYAPFGAQVVSAHYYGAWVLIAAFLLHAGLKLPTVRQSLALRRELEPLRTLAGTPPPAPVQPAAAPAPAAAAIPRRMLLATAAAGSLILLVQGAAGAVGGPVRALGVLAPRGYATGPGPNDFEVNGTIADAGIGMQDIGVDWRLRLGKVGGVDRELTREQLLALPQRTYSLPIACREGWSTTQRWTGVRLRDLAAVVGAHGSTTLTMSALDGAVVALAANQVAADESLLALRVNGVDLSPDHGYPARVIVPAAVGVSCLKWVDSLRFGQLEG